LLLAAVVCGHLAGCSVDLSGNTDIECRPLSTNAISPSRDSSPFHGSVFTVVLENTSAKRLLSGRDTPYIQSLAERYAVASAYTDTFVHPSEPNYIWMVAGQNFGILDDKAPIANHIASTSHIADQIEQAGLTWKTYQESMGEPCGIVSNYPYEPKHNPFVYFDDIVGWDGQNLTRQQRCLDHVVDYSELDNDLAAGTVPDYVFITPNMKHDMHDGSVAAGDTWLARELPKILASEAFLDGGVLFLTGDEGDGRSVTDWSQEDDPIMIVVSPLAKQGYVSEEPYDTSSYLKTVQTLLGLEPLPCGEDPTLVDSMDDLFAVPLPQQ